MSKPHPNAAILIAIANGQSVQYRPYTDVQSYRWVEFDPYNNPVVDIFDESLEWRVKPQLAWREALFGDLAGKLSEPTLVGFLDAFLVYALTEESFDFDDDWDKEDIQNLVQTFLDQPVSGL